MTTTGTIELAGLDGGHHMLTSEQLEDLDSRVQGRLLVAGDQGWNEAVAIWNGMAARLPALVLQPASVHDVAGSHSDEKPSITEPDESSNCTSCPRGNGPRKSCPSSCASDDDTHWFR